MKFLSILLKEGRKEDLKKKYSTKFNEEDLEFILNISDLQDFNHKYTDFVLKNTDGDGELNVTVLETLIDSIKDFNKYQSQLPKKDINQYRNVQELEDSLEPFKRKEREKELENLTEKIYEDNEFLVLRPLSEAASCKYGSNTKWCLTSKGSGHFQRYTGQGQKLYFIINKQKSTDKEFSKIAVHYDNDGSARFYDSQDQTLTQREISILKYAFPEMLLKIDEDFKKGFVSGLEKYLQDAFDVWSTQYKTARNFLGTQKDLIVVAGGFENVRDLGYGHTVGKVEIYLKEGENQVMIDGYDTFVMYSIKDNKSYNFDLGFQGMDESELDLGLEGKQIKSTNLLGGTSEGLNRNVLSYVSNKIYDFISDSPVLKKYLLGTSQVWRPNRSSYGYTFGRNQGLIKKLIDYLDSGEIGTKLDFLEKIGKLNSEIKGGKKYYGIKGQEINRTKTDLRGHFSAFFASAKNAGILDYRKIGRDYFLIKGPNFEAFKEGKLRAL